MSGHSLAATLLLITRSPPRKRPLLEVRSLPPEDDGGSGQWLIAFPLSCDQCRFVKMFSDPRSLYGSSVPPQEQTHSSSAPTTSEVLRFCSRGGFLFPSLQAVMALVSHCVASLSFSWRTLRGWRGMKGQRDSAAPPALALGAAWMRPSSKAGEEISKRCFWAD